MSTAITFEDIERDAKRVNAFAMLAEAASEIATLTVFTLAIRILLDSLTTRLTPDLLDRLSHQERSEITPDLQKIHVLLVQISPRLVGLAGARKIRERIEDLGDVIESLVLRDNADFNNLLAECSVGLGLR